jgi:hypothetical protein
MLYPSGYGRTGTRVVLDDQLWTPEDLEGARGCSPGAAAAPSFLHPEDLAAMMTGAHSVR